MVNRLIDRIKRWFRHQPEQSSQTSVAAQNTERPMSYKTGVVYPETEDRHI